LTERRYVTTHFDGWPAEAATLVTRAIAVHGGMEAWAATSSIRLPFRQGTGPLLRLKGYGETFAAPREYEVRPHECITVFHGYPDDQHVGVFAKGDVRIESLNGRDEPVASVDHRRTFNGFAKYRRWSQLDALYFFGYALWHYHVLPFTLPQAHLVRLLTRRGAPVGIDVIIPPHVHTHCPRQRIYFGADGRIVRHDYVADVIGAWARGSHFWEDYHRCGDLLIACRRRVMVRIGPRPTRVPVLCIQLGVATVQSTPRPSLAPR
jgi:hypothetical protein